MCFERNAVECVPFLRQCWGHLDTPPDVPLRKARVICSSELVYMQRRLDSTCPFGSS